MAKPRLLFADVHQLVLPETLHPQARDFVHDVLKDEKGGVYLEHKVRATHSGQLMPFRCYTGWGMKTGTKSWFSTDRGGTAGYDKPVLVNHDMAVPPLGRVVSAEYQQLKFGDDWDNDWRFPDTGTDLGSGFIVTTSHIKDKEAIQKIMDGRFDTVSTAQTASHAWCSFCGSEVRTGCDHFPGNTYKTEDDDSEYLCYIVTGIFDYHEISFVNRPRQPNAKGLSFQMIKDHLSDETEDLLVMADEDSRPIDGLAVRTSADEELHVDLLDSGDLPSTSIFTGRTSVVINEELEDRKNVQSAPDGIVLEGVDKVKDQSNEDSSKKKEEEKDSSQSEEDQEVQGYVLKDLPEEEKMAYLDVLLSLKDEDLLEPCITDEEAELIEAIDDGIFDAKLSTAARKKLSSKTFCGPGRSFPVNDCAHYTAALRLLSRFKGDKTGIRACIMRRGRSLGCGGAKAKKKDSLENFSFANLARYLKDHLDLTTPMEDSLYLSGITARAGGHAHVFDITWDRKTKLATGFTYKTGQGRPKVEHGHNIWIEGVKDVADEFNGTTRDATAGPTHTHSFTAFLTDSADNRATIVASVDEINQALTLLGKAISEDLLAPTEVERLLDVDSTEIKWDQELADAALKILGRVKSEDKRGEILAGLEKAGFLGDFGEPETDMTDLTKTVVSLTDRLEKAEARLEEATRVSDEKEAANRAVLEENAALKAEKLSDLAFCVVVLTALRDKELVDLDDETVIKEKTDAVLTDVPEDKIGEAIRSLVKELRVVIDPKAPDAKDLLDGKQPDTATIHADDNTNSPKDTSTSGSLPKSLEGLEELERMYEDHDIL